MARYHQRIRVPTCPFCKEEVTRPEPIPGSDFEGGLCRCGAVYVHDPTGHNLGEAMLEAVSFACGGDSETAWQLDAGEDYEERELLGYDGRRHTVVRGQVSFRSGYGALFFVRLKEGAYQAARKRLGKEPRELGLPTPSEAPVRAEKIRTIPAKKKQIKALLEAGDFETLLSMADTHTGVLKNLIALLYAREELLHWQAVAALGKVTRRVGRLEPERVKDTLRRLLWSMNDESGGIGWHSPEAIGEIIAANADIVADFGPVIASHLEGEAVFRRGVLWAIGRIASRHPELVARIRDRVAAFLDDPDPEVRANAAWALGQLEVQAARERISGLLDDQEDVTVFEDGRLKSKKVAQVAREALEQLDKARAH